MKAICFSQFGDPGTLQEGVVADPTPRENEVIVQIKAAALNRVDTWVRKGSPAYPVTLPHILGADGAGVVESTGDGVEGVSVGDRVVVFPALSCGRCELCRNARDNQCTSFEILGTKRPGTYAEFVSVPDDNVLVIPDSLSFEEAAAYPLASLTAWHMIVGRAQLKKGETILIVGGGSGVSVAGIQIAKFIGARVLAVTTHPDKVEKLTAIGADVVFVKEATAGFSSWAHDQTQHKGVDVVMEHVGPATWGESLASLARYGRLVTCGATSGPTVQVELRSLFGRDITVLGARMGTKKEFKDLSNRIFSGTLKPVVDRIFPLAEASAAHRYLESNQHVGKILLRVD